MSAGSISARNSGSRPRDIQGSRAGRRPEGQASLHHKFPRIMPLCDSSLPTGAENWYTRHELSKNRTRFPRWDDCVRMALLSQSDSAVSPEPSAGDDAAADAGHQAAAALQSGSCRLCRWRARAQPAARARRRETNRRRRGRGRTRAPRRPMATPEAPARLDRQRLETSRRRDGRGLGTELENVFPTTAQRRIAPPRVAGAWLFGMVRRRRGRRATATTISKPLSPPRRRSPIISPSSSRSRSPIRPAA